MHRNASSITGCCHCGAICFTADLIDGLDAALRCTCSLCRMRGAVVVMARRDAFQLTSGQEHLASYRFHSGAALHHFCKVCGVYTHHRRRFDPDQFAINVACLAGVSPFDFAELPVVDGVNHPLDGHGDGALSVIGKLRFEPMGASPLRSIRSLRPANGRQGTSDER